jgi:anti-sigma28 factor (negative regulator of flagellin synthesis)
MRIERAVKSTPVGPASPAQPDVPAAPSAPVGVDEVNLSALSQAASGLDPARIEEIQAEVGSGKYEVAAAEVSRNIVDFHLIPID